MTYKDIIFEVLKSENRKMTVSEIWNVAEKKGFIDKLNSSGKNPKNILSSVLYTEYKRGSYKYFESTDEKPKRFYLKK